MTVAWPEVDPTWVLAIEPNDPDSHDSSPFPTSRSGRRIRLDAGADQSSVPVVAQRDGVVVALDGCLFDRDRLRRQIHGALRPDADDASLALAGYEQFGEVLFAQLRGSFVVAVWDSNKDRLLFARDPGGSQPGFFACVGDQVLLAASQAALLATSNVPADLDRLAIARWATLVECLPRRTFYSYIDRLPPGHLLDAIPSGVSVRRFWRPDPSTAEALTPLEAEVRFRELLEQALQRCVSLGPLGVLLSGGADSAAVATAATSVSRAIGVADPIALSYVMPDPDADERATQTLVAGNLGIAHFEIDFETALGPAGLISSGLSLSGRRPLPCANPWEPIWSHLAAEGVRRGCAVIVSGEGGNPWFDPEEAEAADAMLRLRLWELLRMWREERRLWSRRSVARSLLWSAGLRLVLREAALRVLSPGLTRALRLREARRRFPADWTFSDPSLREELCEEWVDRGHLARDGTFREWGRLDKLESASLTAALGAENHFALAQGLGVRFLDPPVDPDLVGFLSSLPGRLVNLNGEWKGLARSIVRAGAGEDAAARLGHAWTGRFLAERMEREAPAALAAMRGLPYLSDLGVVDGTRFYVPGTRDEPAARTRYYQLWQALACEAWLQGHC